MTSMAGSEAGTIMPTRAGSPEAANVCEAILDASDEMTLDDIVKSRGYAMATAAGDFDRMSGNAPGFVSQYANTQIGSPQRGAGHSIV